MICAMPGLSYPSNFTNGLNSAILLYVGAGPETEPINSTWPPGNPLIETNLHAYGDLPSLTLVVPTFPLTWFRPWILLHCYST